MGYTTKIDGLFTLDKPLFDSQVLYLLQFAGTRHIKRNAARLQNVPDPARVAVGLPLGRMVLISFSKSGMKKMAGFQWLTTICHHLVNLDCGVSGFRLLMGEEFSGMVARSFTNILPGCNT